MIVQSCYTPPHARPSRGVHNRTQLVPDRDIDSSCVFCGGGFSMIVMKRRGTESDGRERLMDAALVLFADRGYDGVAIHEIAEAAGMTRAAPYYHFQNKEDLCRAAVSREMERTAAKLA